MKLILGMGNKRNLATFCQFVENIRNICDFITFHFEDSRLYSQGMSEDHCSIFELAISSEWFEFYEKKESDTQTLTLRTSTLAKVLDTRQKSQFLVITYEGNPNKIGIILKNKPKDEITNEYPKGLRFLSHWIMNCLRSRRKNTQSISTSIQIIYVILLNN